MTLDVPGWVAFTLLAAFMQAARTAGQKHLTRRITAFSSTLVRYVFGWPFAVAYLLFIHQGHTTTAITHAATDLHFVVYVILASIAQIVATVLLVKVFGFRNFTVGTSFAKTEAVQAAVFGTLFFGSLLNPFGWLAVFIGFVGIIIVSHPGYRQPWDKRNVLYGTASGTAFAFTSLWLREASLGLGGDAVESAALTLFFMVSLQALLCVGISIVKEPGEIARVMSGKSLALFVGFTSAAGSVGWFTAMTLQNPALVKSLGQIEILFTLLLTTLFFKERISLKEAVGVAAIIASVLLLLLLS